MLARANVCGLYGPDSEMNAVPLEKAFMVWFITGSGVLLLIALSKFVFGKTDKVYYGVYAGLVAALMLTTWVLIAFAGIKEINGTICGLVCI